MRGWPGFDSGRVLARRSWAARASPGLPLTAAAIAPGPHEKLADERKLCDDLDHFYVTDAAERFARVAERFLGSAPSVLEAVEVWGNDELRTN